MGDFFRAYKRKVGVVTLGLACVLAVGWIRSQICEDRVRISIGNTVHTFESGRDNVHWSKSRFRHGTENPRVEWTTATLPPPRQLRLVIRQGG